MGGSVIDRAIGRHAFGDDPAAYHAARPAYPSWVFAALCTQCGLAPGTATFEIGAGTGKATRRLLDLGANPVVAVEPDPRMAAFLRETNREEALQIIVSSFEDAALRQAGFDLGVCATAFHWLDEDIALLKVAKLLRPGGWWASVSNVFGDDSRPDPFHEATRELLNGPPSPSAATRDVPFALDAEARLEALRRNGGFDVLDHRISAWSIELDPEQTIALYATYSNINIRSDRKAVLAELGRIARETFNGRVIRNMTTSLYMARRRS